MTRQFVPPVCQLEDEKRGENFQSEVGKKEK